MKVRVLSSLVQPMHERITEQILSATQEDGSRFALFHQPWPLFACGIRRETVSAILSPHSHEESGDPRLYVWMHHNLDLAELQVAMFQALSKGSGEGISFWLLHTWDDELVAAE